MQRRRYGMTEGTSPVTWIYSSVSERIAAVGSRPTNHTCIEGRSLLMVSKISLHSHKTPSTLGSWLKFPTNSKLSSSLCSGVGTSSWVRGERRKGMTAGCIPGTNEASIAASSVVGTMTIAER